LGRFLRHPNKFVFQIWIQFYCWEYFNTFIGWVRSLKIISFNRALAIWWIVRIPVYPKIYKCIFYNFNEKYTFLVRLFNFWSFLCKRVSIFGIISLHFSILALYYFNILDFFRLSYLIFELIIWLFPLLSGIIIVPYISVYYISCDEALNFIESMLLFFKSIILILSCPSDEQNNFI